MKSSHPPIHQIELRIDRLSELFNSMDRDPVPHSELDRAAQEILESWAEEFPANSRCRIIGCFMIPGVAKILL